MKKIQRTLSDVGAAVLVYPIVGAYRLFFGWWLSDLMDRRYENLLRERVKHSFSFLFEEFGAQFVPNDPGYVWTKGKMITLHAKNIRLRMSHDRSDDFVDVAPVCLPDDWEPLSHALMAVGATRPLRSKADIPTYPLFPQLEDIGTWLKRHITNLEEAYEARNYTDTKRAIQMIQSFPGLGKSGRFVRCTSIDETNGTRFQTLGL